MNSTRSGMLHSTSKRSPAHFFKISLLVLLLMTACSPAAAPATPAAVLKPVLEGQATSSVATPFSTPEEEVIYPYYLPLAQKPDVPPQTINGVTTQIDWAYADESRIAIHYTISGLDWPEGTVLDPMQQVQMASETVPDLWMGGLSANVSPVQQGVITGSFDQRLVDGALEQKEHPNLRVNVDIPVVGTSSVGTFHFVLDLPVLPGSKLENIDQTVVANDVAMTLKDLRLTPSHAQATICFQMPSEADWGLAASMMKVGDRDYPFMEGGPISRPEGKEIAVTDPERCSFIGFDITGGESAGSLTLTVPQLMGSVPEVITQDRVDRANQRLADSGIEFQYINLDHGGQVEILKRPEGKMDEEIYPLIWEALSDQHEGPWVFTIPIER